jgi:carbon-monoxide dehydrogenase medium subunit
MKPAPFVRLTPEHPDQACAQLAEFGPDARPLAGGQSLVPLMARRLVRPAVLVDLGGLPDLDFIRPDPGAITIGATTRQRTLERSPLIRSSLPLLATAVRWIGHPQVRNRGTIGGSLAFADPAAELPAVALALGAVLILQSATAPLREVPAKEFFEADGPPVRPGELLREIRFPIPAPGAGYGFQETSRRHRDFALVGVATMIEPTPDGVSVRMALMGTNPRPRRAVSVEQGLLGRRPDPEVIAQAARLVQRDVDPVDDVHADARYRRSVAATLVRRALTEAAGSVRSSR